VVVDTEATASAGEGIIDFKLIRPEFGVSQLYVLAAIAGLTVGIIVWFLSSHWIASSLNWVEDRRPELIGSTRLRVGQAVACGALVLACSALAFWIARVLWLQMR
jgi:hypothetical protein